MDSTQCDVWCGLVHEYLSTILHNSTLYINLHQYGNVKSINKIV